MKISTDVKINLGLRILRRRPDGFHDIETLFVPYRGMHDTLYIDPSGPGEAASIEISCGGWDPSSDLSWRAYLLLKSEFSLPEVKIRLEKHAPVGAGLGSGSSDAAFTLRALNDMFSLSLSRDRLASYAARLGSDCAFFIYDTPMFGEGRGDVLTPFDIDLSQYRIEVEVPDRIHVSTGTAYSLVHPREESGSTLLQGGTISGQSDMTLREVLGLPVTSWRDTLVNDFEPSVFALYPEISRLKESFYERGAIYASMSGSGSAVFGIFGRQPDYK